MPRIPLINAQGQPGILQLPRPTPQSFGAEGFKGLTQFGKTLGDIADRLQDQQDKLDLADLAGQYEGGLATIRLDLKQDPDYRSHAMKFTQRVTVLQSELAKRTTSTTVRTALQAHIARTLPEQTVNVQTDALTLWTQHQQAGLDLQGEILSKSAAEAASPEARDEKILLHEGLLLGAEQQRILSPVQRQERRRIFEQKVVGKHMDFLRRTDREKLRELDRQGAFEALDVTVRLKTLEGARADEEAEQRRQERSFKQAQDAVERNWSSLANQGQLPDAELEAALKGDDPFITPDKARTYKERNEKPITGEGNLQVRAIMQEYHTGSRTQERIDKTRAELNRMLRESGQPNALVDTALKELQAHESEGRSIRAAEISAGIKSAEDQYKAKSGIVLPGRLGTMQKNKEAAELAELREQIRKGKDPAKAVEDMLKRRQTETDVLPDRTKGVLELSK